MKKLQYFLTVAETLSFKKAAEKLYISTQALSFQVIQIKNELGTRLLDSTTKRAYECIYKTGSPFAGLFETLRDFKTK